MLSRTIAPRAAHLAIRYAAAVTTAHIVAMGEVILILASLRPTATGATRVLTDDSNMLLLVSTAIIGVSVVALGSIAIVLPALQWHTKELEPDRRQRHSALTIPRRQSAILAVVWVASGLATIAANSDRASSVAVLIAPAVLLGAAAAVCTALLLTLHTLRPVIAAATPLAASRETAPGVHARLLTMWVLSCALPNLGIVLLVMAGSRGIAIDPSVSLEVPVVAMAIVAVLWGLRAIVLVARSISDPVGDVVTAMAEVEQGDLRRSVAVYERSEIGRLQDGFNRMVAGLRERDRLRDLFSRHVGADIVNLLIERDKSIYRDVREVAVLFVDLTKSTQLAVARPPQEVAEILNNFFQAVVAAVDDHHGFVNKFQGDAALAVFGAPIRNAHSATDALLTARDLAKRMQSVTAVDFGIGVSAGQVFAGYLGALNRFEYTVVGDPVNEAARLADRAKSLRGRVACSGAALARADDDEMTRWYTLGSEVLRGRSAATEVSVPFER